MRGLARPEGIGAAAGVALVVLVFLPWWTLDTGGLGGGSPESAPAEEIRGFLTASTRGTSLSAWDGTPRTAVVWILTGLLAITHAAAVRVDMGVYVRRTSAAVLVAMGAIAMLLAAWRCLDSPFDSYTTGTWAYASLAACAVVALSAVASLRREPPRSA